MAESSSHEFIAATPGECARCAARIRVGDRVGLLNRLTRRLCIPCLRIEEPLEPVGR